MTAVNQLIMYSLRPYASSLMINQKFHFNHIYIYIYSSNGIILAKQFTSMQSIWPCTVVETPSFPQQQLVYHILKNTFSLVTSQFSMWFTHSMM